MVKIFIDTNYFLRFLLKDNAAQHAKAKDLLKQGARNEVSMKTSLITVFEVYWVLESVYGKTKTEAVKTLEKLLRLNFIELPERPILSSALKLFGQGKLDDLEDCYNLYYALAVGADQLATFDKKLIREFESIQKS